MAHSPLVKFIVSCIGISSISGQITSTTSSTTSPSSSTNKDIYCDFDDELIVIQCNVHVPISTPFFRLQVTPGGVSEWYYHTSGWFNVQLRGPQDDVLIIQALFWDVPTKSQHQSESQDQAIVFVTRFKNTSSAPQTTQIPCRDDPDLIPDSLLVNGEKMTCQGESLNYCYTFGYEAILKSCPLSCRSCVTSTTSSTTSLSTSTSSSSTSSRVTSTKTSHTSATDNYDCGCHPRKPCRDDATSQCFDYMNSQYRLCHPDHSSCAQRVMFVCLAYSPERNGLFFGTGSKCTEFDARQGNPNRLVQDIGTFAAYTQPSHTRKLWCLKTAQTVSHTSFFAPATTRSCQTSFPQDFGTSMFELYLPEKNEFTATILPLICVWNDENKHTELKFGIGRECNGSLYDASSGFSLATAFVAEPCLPGFTLGSSIGLANLEVWSCIDIQECDIRELNTCSVHSTCTNTKGSFLCSCNHGFKGDGINCQDIQECLQTHTCEKDYICHESPGSFYCECREGYFERNVTTGHSKCIAHCKLYGCTSSTEFNHVHGENAYCSDTIDGSFCTCLEGYTAEKTDGLCVDVNECEVLSFCHSRAECVNTNGSFTCECVKDWKGNGTECRPTCSLDPELCDSNAVCDLSLGCSCNPGFQGDGFSCFEINECHGNLDNCDEHAECLDTFGSFECNCKDGWIGLGTSCADEKECEEYPPKCGGNAICVEQEGSFVCICLPGYVSTGQAECKMSTTTLTTSSSISSSTSATSLTTISVTSTSSSLTETRTSSTKTFTSTSTSLTATSLTETETSSTRSYTSTTTSFTLSSITVTDTTSTISQTSTSSSSTSKATSTTSTQTAPIASESNDGSRIWISSIVMVILFCIILILLFVVCNKRVNSKTSPVIVSAIEQRHNEIEAPTKWDPPNSQTNTLDLIFNGSDFQSSTL